MEIRVNTNGYLPTIVDGQERRACDPLKLYLSDPLRTGEISIPSLRAVALPQRQVAIL